MTDEVNQFFLRIKSLEKGPSFKKQLTSNQRENSPAAVEVDRPQPMIKGQ